ncbi:MAG: glycosyltransferase family 2 protein [Cytophagales bacterium]
MFGNSLLKIAIVIPCYKVELHIEKVITSLPSFVDYVIAVNDCSPDFTKNVILNVAISNTKVIYVENTVNQGVGGAMIAGFKKAIDLNCDIVVKLDGDGQMNAAYIEKLIIPLVESKADFTKGNRFRNHKALRQMPFIRRIGNIGLSFLTKAASGYWNVFDPTNGFIAINQEVLRNIDFERLHKRYFFESSLLIELYHTEAAIKDIPMDAQYGTEVSNLSVTKTLFEFPPKLLKAFFRRIVFKYFLYDFNIASLYILFGMPLLILGFWYGFSNFIYYSQHNISAPTGTVVIPTLMITIGFQLMLSAINFDISNYPKK